MPFYFCGIWGYHPAPASGLDTPRPPAPGLRAPIVRPRPPDPPQKAPRKPAAAAPAPESPAERAEHVRDGLRGYARLG